MRRSTTSPDGNASGCRSARIAIYCAVHSPMPGIAANAASVDGLSKSNERSHTALASERIALARVAMMPASSSRASASWAAFGNSRFNPWQSSTGVPHLAATRAAMVVAARTVICCPRIARTESSNGSHAPGTRTPACLAHARVNNGSEAKCPVIAMASAATSNMRFTRSTTVGVEGAAAPCTSSHSASASVARLTTIEPATPSHAIVRR